MDPKEDEVKKKGESSQTTTTSHTAEPNREKVTEEEKTLREEAIE